MDDLNRVIYDIERCTSHVPDACRDCSKCGSGMKCMESLLGDSLKLLEKQVPKPPRISQTVDKIFYACDSCGKSLFIIVDSGTLNASSVFPKFCSECGQAVKWND